MSSSPSESRRHRVRPCLAAGSAAISAACGRPGGSLDPASPDAALVAELAAWMVAVASLVLIVTLGVLLLGIGLQRRGARRLTRRRATVLVLGGGVVAPLLAAAAISASGLLISDRTEDRAARRGPTVEVVGKRWWWEFRYLDADGAVVATTANELHLPAGRRTRLRLVSDNVIHSFWAPKLQGKTDLVPGTVNRLHVEPEAPGVYRGQCAELCGLQHAMMGFLVVAEPPEAFAAWLARQARPAGTDPVPEVFLSAGCAGCHTVRGTDAVGELGPDLTHLASRRTLAAGRLENSRENLRLWITAGQAVKPGNLMPEFALPRDDMRALLDFLEALE